MGLLFYWRIIVLIALVTLFLTNIISLETFLAFILGITIFYGIPALFKYVKKRRKDISSR